MKKEGRGLFDENFRLEKLSTQGYPLEKLNKHVKWEKFRPLLNEAFKREKRGVGGAKPLSCHDVQGAYYSTILQYIGWSNGISDK